MAPRRLLTRPRARTCIVDVARSRIAFAPLETGRRSDYAVAPIPISSRAFRRLLYTADARFVERIDENVSQAGIGGRAAPIYSPDGAGEKHRRIRLRAFFTIQIRRKWSDVVQAATALREVAAQLCMPIICVSCSDYVIRFVDVSCQQGSLYGTRLSDDNAFDRHVADRYGSFFDFEHRFTCEPIENVHVCMFRHGDRCRNLFTFDIDVDKRDG